ncbi:MAG: hypothetical protein ACPLRW_10940 [Moorellales bacterium]
MAREKTKLTAVRFPESLLRELNRAVGRGRRSEFIVRATEQALLRLKQGRALREYRGIFRAEEYPEFDNPDKTRAWVENLRREADERMKTLDEGR